MQSYHTRSNFITEDGLIAMGSCPPGDSFQKMLDMGIELFVSLEQEIPWYKNTVGNTVKIIHIPIKSGHAPSMKLAKHLVEDIIEAYKLKKRVYIHCNGGHGRAGTISALVVGKLYSLDACDAISTIEKYRETRQDTSRNFIPCPETNAQVALISKILGVSPNKKLPDRSDRTWLSIVKAERKLK